MRAALIIVAAAVVVGMTIYALLDIGRTERHRIVALPKWAWFIIALIVPVIGPGLWLAFGYRRRPSGGRRADAHPTAGSAPDDDEKYLRFLQQQAERRRRDEERRRRESGENDR
ncbi:PLD nuclease N-terminal domain-containing protein [Kocuria massiliensis]|uniref:PLD nuclease N-terminal domain-containing protein n=1 Tax=Kocuria massiliensis TaxID=1926282 RepID=UPI0022B99A30|nr:PLD nuclease N-terminal domain-containing protein [Kocuria massiliensis]